jgi:hypothetical protein
MSITSYKENHDSNSILLHTSMNDSYNETITRNGRSYHYDPDSDSYRCTSTAESTVSRYAWIPTVVVLAAIAYYVEHMQ